MVVVEGGRREKETVKKCPQQLVNHTVKEILRTRHRSLPIDQLTYPFTWTCSIKTHTALIAENYVHAIIFYMNMSCHCIFICMYLLHNVCWRLFSKKKRNRVNFLFCMEVSACMFVCVCTYTCLVGLYCNIHGTWTWRFLLFKDLFFWYVF